MLHFSIVIPTYNCAAYLRRALHSAVEQTPPASQVIVIDDGSTDDTRQVVESSGSSVQYLYQEHQGPFMACKHGIARAPAEGFVVFLDADDRLRPGYLEAMAHALTARPKTALAFGQVIHVDQAGHPRHPPLPGLYAEPIMNFRAFMRGELELSAGGGVFARRVFAPWFERSESLSHVYGLDRVVVAQALANHQALVVPAAEVELHDRPGRLRDDVEAMCATSLDALDVLFDDRVLPEAAMRERPMFRKRLLLEQARLLYRKRRYEEAVERYRQVLAYHSWRALGRRHGKRHLISEGYAWINRIRGR